MLSIQSATELLQRLFQDHPTKTFAFRLWDGSEVAWGPDRAFTVIFHDPETLQSLLRSMDPALFAVAYVENRIDITGDLYGAIALGSYLRSVKLKLGEKFRAALRLGVPARRHTREKDTRDVQAHYDLSNDFYRLFLDANLNYSCAYFASPDQSLEAAQERKLDLICRKLRLAPGETFLDVGCGWGALILWAAQRYGVRAHGITLSKNQLELARARIRDAGLEDRVTVELRHYLDLPRDATYHKIASIGMIEHVGIRSYPEYFGALYRALAPGGLLLNHGITVKQRDRERTGGEFILTHVFPGAELDTLWHTLRETEEAGFEIVDVEDLRPHYALTLREWQRRFSARESEAAALVPERILRIWRLYLPSCALGFEEGIISIYQTIASKNDDTGRSRAPLTREDILLSALGGGAIRSSAQARQSRDF